MMMKVKAGLLAAGAGWTLLQLGSCVADLVQDVLVGVIFD
jgi:hypothetical protein